MQKDLDSNIAEIHWPRAYIRLSHEELLEDMRSFGEELASSPEKAQAFLRQIGIIDKNGDVKHLIPD